MPHVVLKGSLSIRQWADAFVPLQEETTEWRIKIQDVFVEQGGGCAILPAIVVEEGHTQTFYILVSGTPGQQRFTVRLDPLTDPIKTRGVKRSVGLIAETLTSRVPLVTDKNNIPGFWTVPEQAELRES